MRRPIDQLVSLYPDSSNFQKQVEALKPRYCAWRDVSNDGNCLYHSVLRAVLEHFLRPFVGIRELELFYLRIYYFAEIGSDDETVPHLIRVLKTLWKLMEVKRSGTDDAISHLHTLLSLREVSTSFVLVLRAAAYEALLIEWPQEYMYEGIEEDEEFAEMLDLGHVSGEHDLVGLTLAFNLSIHEAELGKNNFSVVHKPFPKSNRATDTRVVEVHVALISGHYCLLYRRGLETLEEEVDGVYRNLQRDNEDARKEYEKIVESS